MSPSLTEDVRRIFAEFDKRKRNKMQKKKRELKNSSGYDPSSTFMGQPEQQPGFKKKN